MLPGYDDLPDVKAGGDYNDLPDAHPYADLPKTQTATPYDDLPDVDTDSAWDKVKGAAAKFAVGEAEGLQRTAANIGQGVAQLSDPGPLKHDFRHFLQAQDEALKETKVSDYDPVTNQIKERDTLGRAMGKMENQRELRREAARRPGESFSQAATELADELNWVKDVTPGPKIAGTAGEKVGETAGMMAPSAIPVVGPMVGAVTAGAASTGATFDEAYKVYLDAGYSEDDARAKAQDVAAKTGATTALIFALPVGHLASMPKSAVARLLAAAGIGGGQMGADTLQSRLRAQASYNPNLTLSDIAKDTGQSAVFGALFSGLTHGATELSKPRPIDDVPEAAAPEPPKAAPVDVSPDMLADLQRTISENQVKPPVRMPGRDMLDELHQNDANVAPESGTIVPVGTKITAKNDAALTEPGQGETTEPGAAAETITGQNEQKGSEEPAATTSAAGPMPAEGLETPQTPRPPSKAGKNPFFLRPRSDGVPDILDDIQELGGIRRPGEFSGGEYDGFREAMTGPARMLIKSGAHAPDTLIQELRSMGGVGNEGGSAWQRIETPDDLWGAIGAAVKSRDKLREVESNQRVEGKQVSEFQRRAVQDDRPKKESGTYTPVPVDKMMEGDVFKVQNQSFTVKHLEFDQGNNLAFVEVKDGPKFGVQRVDGNEFIHVDKGSFEAGPDHDGNPPPELARAAKQPVPSNKDIGGATAGPAMELKEEATPENLDKNALHFYGKRHAELSPKEQAELTRATEAEEIPRRQQRGRAEGRQPVNPREQTGESKSPGSETRPVPPAAAETGNPIEKHLEWLNQEHARLESELKTDATDANGQPKSRLGIGRLAQLRHIEGQMDILREIASADPELKAKWFKKFLEGDAPSAVDPVIDALKSLKVDMKGKLHAFGLVPEMWNKMVDLVILGVRGGRKLAEAIEWAFKTFKERNPDAAFDEDGAREYFETTQPGNLRYESPEGKPVSPVDQMKTRRAEIDQRLQEIPKDVAALRREQMDSPLSIDRWSAENGHRFEALRSERFRLATERRDLTKNLLQDPSYVRELILASESKSAEYQAAKAAGDKDRTRDIVEESLPGTGDVKTELERVAPELLDQMRKQLEAEGKLKPMPKGRPLGRSLADLTDWLKTNKVDSPKIPLRDRLNLARRLTDEFYKGKDAMTKTFGWARAKWEAFKAQYKAPPIDTDFRSLMKNWFFEKQWTGLETHKWVHEIKKAVPQKIRREAIAVWLDADGDPNLIRSQAEMMPARWRPIWETALKLTPEEKALARQIKIDFAQKLTDGQLLGLIDKGRADYGVPQLWKVEPKYEGAYDPADPQWKNPRTARNATSRLDPRDPFFSLQRTVPSYFDGIMAGGTPRSMDVGDLVGRYNTDFHDAMADRGVIKDLKDAKSADGKPIVRISGGTRIDAKPGEPIAKTFFVDSKWKPEDAVTEDGRPYVFIDHWALRDWKFSSVDADGNPIILKGDFLVHPDHVKFLKNELGKSALRDVEQYGGVGNPALKAAAFLKASKFASATFHMFTLGEHAAFHGVSPFTHGVDIDPGQNPKLALLMRHGLELGFGGQRELMEEGLSSHGGIWSKVPGLGELMQAQSEFLFKRYLPALKTKVGLTVLERNMKRYAGELTDDQIYELTAGQMNAAFGGQNWKLLGTNKTYLDASRLLFTAPDFLLSRSKVVGQFFKPYNAEQRWFLLAQAGLVYTAVRVLNYLLDGDPHWEPANALRVVHNGRSYAARFIVNDIEGLTHDLASSDQGLNFVSGRIGPWPRSVAEAIWQRDLRTGNRKDVLVPTSSAGLRAAEILLQDGGEWLIPVGMEGLIPGAAARDQSKPGQMALALIGVGSRKYSAATQMWQLATQFNRDSTDPAARSYQKQQDMRSHAEGAYRKLDDLLDAKDLDRALTEYSALRAEGKTDEGFKSHFQPRPFTGNATREALFVDKLTPAQQKIYYQAKQDQLTRVEEFQKMLDKLPGDSAGAAP